MSSYYEKFPDGKVACIDDEIPFEIPKGWEWVRIKHICSMQAGKNISSSEISPFVTSTKIYPCYGGNGLRGYVSRYNTIGTYPIIGRQGALCGNVNMASGEFYATEHAVVTDNYYQTDVKWLYWFLTALNLNQYATATAQPGLAVSNIIEVLLPIPPRKEQTAIAQTLDRIEPIINRYDESETNLSKLNNAIKIDLQKSILQEAIQGRLVPQNPDEEPAAKLLERINAEKQRLAKEGKLNVCSVIFKGDDNKYYEKAGNAAKNIDDEIPFLIPSSWVWCRLDDICSYIHRGKSPKYSEIKKVPVIAQKCNQWSGFNIEKAQFIDPSTTKSYSAEHFLQQNDLLWNSTGLGTLGRMAMYEVEKNPYGIAVADSHVTVIRPISSYVNPKYLYYYFSSPTVQSVIEDRADGSTKQKELSTKTVSAYIIPLPPKAEQDRIVAKIEEVLASIMSR